MYVIMSDIMYIMSGIMYDIMYIMSGLCLVLCMILLCILCLDYVTICELILDMASPDLTCNFFFSSTPSPRRMLKTLTVFESGATVSDVPRITHNNPTIIINSDNYY